MEMTDKQAATHYRILYEVAAKELEQEKAESIDYLDALNIERERKWDITEKFEKLSGVFKSALNSGDLPEDTARVFAEVIKELEL